MTISPSAGTMAVPTLTNFLPNFRKRAIVEGKRPCGASSHACAKEYQGWLALQSMQNRQTRHRLLRPHQESFVGFSPSEKRNSHAARKSDLTRLLESSQEVMIVHRLLQSFLHML